MATNTAKQLKNFHRFIGDQLQNGGPTMSPEECLTLWRVEQERADTLAGIQEGLDDLKAGRVRPIEAFDTEFRRKHNIPQDS